MKNIKIFSHEKMKSRYKKPIHWHSEIVYFDQDKQGWQVLGCRPPFCEVVSLEDLKQDFSGYVIDVRHLKVDPIKFEEGRELFNSEFAGKNYSLVGQEKTNCTDVGVSVFKKMDVSGVDRIRFKTKKKLEGLKGVTALLRKGGIYNADRFMQRDELVFPDELERLGQYIGNLKL